MKTRSSWQFGRAWAGAAVVAAVLALPATAPVQAAGTDLGVAVTNSVMKTQPSAQSFGKWSYQVGLYLFGQYNVYRRTRDARLLTYMKDWADAHLDANGQPRNGTSPVALNSLDDRMSGRVCLELYREFKDEKYRKCVEIIRRRFDAHPRTASGGFWHTVTATGKLWADGTFMMVPFLIEYGKTFNDQASIDEGVRQLLVYASHLQDPVTGLLWHGYDETGKSAWLQPGTKHSQEFWCRADGWFGVATAMTLDRIGAHPQRAALVDVARKLANGLATYQDPASGRWFQVINKGGYAGNWTETSCTAMHVYFLKRGVAQGYLAQRFVEVATRGYQGLLRRLTIDAGGRTTLAGISAGTSIGDLAYYLARPQLSNDRHGLGAFLLTHEVAGVLPSGASLAMMEAEDGVRGAPWKRVADDEAVGGAALRLPAGVSSIVEPPQSGRVVFDFAVANTGSYKLWARVRTPAPARASLWVNLDDEAEWRDWRFISKGEGWHWDEMHTSARQTPLPVPLPLTAGSHRLTLAYRQDGVRVDRLLLTDASDYIPGGEGP